MTPNTRAVSDAEWRSGEYDDWLASTLCGDDEAPIRDDRQMDLDLIERRRVCRDRPEWR